jgi:sugar phosphate isomerase/epimerase
MNKVGIRAHDVATTSASALAAKIMDLGFDGAQLVLKKALKDPVDFDHCPELVEGFRDLTIMMLGAYFNPVHPDLTVREEGIATFKAHLHLAQTLNVPYVGTETGSLMGSPWGYLPKNHLPQTLDQVIAVFTELLQTAEQVGKDIALEGAWAHVVYSPHKVREVLDRLANPHLKVTVDLFNFLHVGNHEDRMTLLEECFHLFKNEIVIYHLKDYIVQDGRLKQVGLGAGLMDFKTIIRRIQEETPNAFLIFEGVTGNDIPPSLSLIRQLLKGENKL